MLGTLKVGAFVAGDVLSPILDGVRVCCRVGTGVAVVRSWIVPPVQCVDELSVDVAGWADVSHDIVVVVLFKFLSEGSLSYVIRCLFLFC